jgi:hypothetical protein
MIVFYKQTIDAKPIPDGVVLPHSFLLMARFFSMEEKRERSVKVRVFHRLEAHSSSEAMNLAGIWQGKLKNVKHY